MASSDKCDLVKLLGSLVGRWVKMKGGMRRLDADGPPIPWAPCWAFGHLLPLITRGSHIAYLLYLVLTPRMKQRPSVQARLRQSTVSLSLLCRATLLNHSLADLYLLSDF